MEVLLMDIAVEALLRNCIKERRAEGIAVRNDPMTRLLGRDAEEGLYWDPRHPQRTLCLIGATKSESRREAATLLGISMAEARDLEHGFEDWRMATEVDRNGPFFKLGRQLGQELEAEMLLELDTAHVEAVEAEQAVKE